MKTHFITLIAAMLFAPIGAISDPLPEQEFGFFNEPIDYWGESDRSKTKEPEANKDLVPSTKEKPSETFSWKKHLDPNNKEFFREGNHMPPDAFIELVKNPSDENIKNWFKYIDLKNQLAQNLQKRLEAYAQKQGASLSGEEQEVLHRKIAEIPTVPKDVKRYRFRLYLDSGCPYCKEMLSTMASLNSQGFFVEVLQIDDNVEKLRGSPVVVSKANPTDVERHRISGVPLLLVGDMEKNVVFRISGYQTVESIFAQLRS